MTWTPRAMFVLLPLFAWLVSIVRRKSGRKYPQHVIYACHVFAVLFGIQSAAVAAGYLTRTTTVRVGLGLISLLYSLFYVVFALKAVYGGTILRAVGDTAIVVTLYWVATIMVAAAISVPVLFWK